MLIDENKIVRSLPKKNNRWYCVMYVWSEFLNSDLFIDYFLNFSQYFSNIFLWIFFHVNRRINFRFSLSLITYIFWQFFCCKFFFLFNWNHHQNRGSRGLTVFIFQCIDRDFLTIDSSSYKRKWCFIIFDNYPIIWLIDWYISFCMSEWHLWLLYSSPQSCFLCLNLATL